MKSSQTESDTGEQENDEQARFIQTDSEEGRKESNDHDPAGHCFLGLRKVLCCSLLPCLPARYVLVVIGFTGLALDYALRINLSMAIIEMDFGWTAEQEGWVLSSFFYGYITTQLLGGYLASRFGGRHVFGTGLLMISLLTLLTPLVAQIHFGALMALRVLEGISEGVTLPAMHAIWGKWAPPKERSFLTAITYSGTFFGHVIGFFVSAVLSQYGGGWPTIFYGLGGAGIVWYVFWLYLAFSSPSTHPRISAKEREYIETSIEEDHLDHNPLDKVPWFSILTSPAVWAIIVAHFSFNWGMYTLMTCVPSYFKDVLSLSAEHESLVENGFVSSIPYIANVVIASFSGQVADIFIRMSCPIVVVRKVSTVLGLLFAGGGLLGVGFVGSNETEAVLFLVISVGLSGITTTGFLVNDLDIAPQYAGILFGITNSIATIPGMLGPVVAKSITREPTVVDPEDYFALYQEEWREVFIIAAEIYAFGAIMYVILGRADRQRWAGGRSNAGTGSGSSSPTKKSIETEKNVMPEADLLELKETTAATKED